MKLQLSKLTSFRRELCTWDLVLFQRDSLSVENILNPSYVNLSTILHFADFSYLLCVSLASLGSRVPIPEREQRTQTFTGSGGHLEPWISSNSHAPRGSRELPSPQRTTPAIVLARAPCPPTLLENAHKHWNKPFINPAAPFPVTQTTAISLPCVNSDSIHRNLRVIWVLRPLIAYVFAGWDRTICTVKSSSRVLSFVNPTLEGTLNFYSGVPSNINNL